MSVERELGELTARMDNVEKVMGSVQETNKKLLVHISEGRGARRMLNTMWVVGVCVLSLKFGDIKTMFIK